MSRQAQLPPRCPLQKKTMDHQANVHVSTPSGKDIKLHQGQNGHYTSISRSSITEEPPQWLNDLLTDSDSDSTLLDGPVVLPSLANLNTNENVDLCEPDDGLGSTCLYGPNSPRRKNKSGFPQNEIVSAFSEYVMQNTLQPLDGYGVLQSDSFGDARGLMDEISSENTPMKRHPGQRSRARKLQYIAELERNVDVLQNLRSELAVRVASLIQQCAALSMENNTLKEQLLRMKHQKFIVDGEYESLKNERLRTRSAVSSNTNKIHNRSYSAANFTRSDAIWNMLDMRKLDLD